MTVKMGRAFSMLNSDPLIVFRRENDYWDSTGARVDGQRVKYKMLGSMQSAAGGSKWASEFIDADALDGERNSDGRIFITNGKVHTARDLEEDQADLIYYDDKFFRAIQVTDWEPYGYWSVLAIRCEPDFDLENVL